MPTKNVTYKGTDYVLSNDDQDTPPGRTLLTDSALWAVADGIAGEAVDDPNFFGITVGNPKGVEREISSLLKAGTVRVFQ